MIEVMPMYFSCQVKLIYSRIHRGTGVEGDPHRVVHQLWTMNGDLVVEKDMADGADVGIGIERLMDE